MQPEMGAGRAASGPRAEQVLVLLRLPGHTGGRQGSSRVRCVYCHSGTREQTPRRQSGSEGAAADAHAAHSWMLLRGPLGHQQPEEGFGEVPRKPPNARPPGRWSPTCGGRPGAAAVTGGGTRPGRTRPRPQQRGPCGPCAQHAPAPFSRRKQEMSSIHTHETPTWLHVAQKQNRL